MTPDTSLSFNSTTARNLGHLMQAKECILNENHYVCARQRQFAASIYPNTVATHSAKNCPLQEAASLLPTALCQSIRFISAWNGKLQARPLATGAHKDDRRHVQNELLYTESVPLAKSIATTANANDLC